MPPTGEDDVYPLPGLLGCVHIFAYVGTGMQLVKLGVDAVVLDLGAGVLTDGQVYTEVLIVGAGFDGPLGGYLERQSSLEHREPGQ